MLEQTDQEGAFKMTSVEGSGLTPHRVALLVVVGEYCALLCAREDGDPEESTESRYALSKFLVAEMQVSERYVELYPLLSRTSTYS